MFTQIDFSKTYRIEAIPSIAHKELGEKGLSAYPGTSTTISVGYNDTLKRYTGTGLDVNDPEILSLSAEKKKLAKEWIIEQKESLEALIGFPGWLDPTSDNWTSDLCISVIETGNDLKVRFNDHSNVLNPSENYKDKIALIIIFNDPEFPKSKHELGDPKFRNAKFYLTTDDEVSEISKDKRRKKGKAIKVLYELFEESKNSKRAWEIAFYLKLVSKQKVSAEELEEKLDVYINSDPTGENQENFLEACEMSNDILLVYNMFRAATPGIVNISPDGYYHRGHVNYRKSIEDSVKYLLTPDMQTELAELREEVNKKKKKYNALA